jgi:hypothetical protein
MRRSKDPLLPKNRIDDSANDAKKHLGNVKKKHGSRDIMTEVKAAIEDLNKILKDNHHQA